MEHGAAGLGQGMKRWLTDVLSGRRDNFRLRSELTHTKMLLAHSNVEIRGLRLQLRQLADALVRLNSEEK